MEKMNIDEVLLSAQKEEAEMEKTSDEEDSDNDSDGDDGDDSDDDDNSSVGSSGSYSSSSSYLSSDMEDEFLSMFPDKKQTLKRSNSLPSFQGEEMSTMQVAILLNQVRVDDGQKKEKKRLEKSSQKQQRRGSLTQNFRSGVSTKSAPGKMVKMKHIQGTGTQDTEEPDLDEQDPTDRLNEILAAAGYAPRVLTYEETEEYFTGITSSRLNSYSSDIITAVRGSDLDFLRKNYADLNRNMNACNRFGESILHTACRKSQVKVVNFLLHEAKVNVRVRDDFGRTPCHDAAWQGTPSMKLIEMVIIECPDLLVVQDKRGFTPLQYVRKPHRKAWNDMFDRLGDSVLPKHLISSTDEAVAF